MLRKLERLIEVERSLEKIKALYSERTKLIQDIVNATDKRQFKTKNHSVLLVDSFDEKCTAFKAVHFSRFEVYVAKLGLFKIKRRHK